MITETQRKLLAQMRKTARRAAYARLHGRMDEARKLDIGIEWLYEQGKRLRLREGALMHAEEKGRQEGGRHHTRERLQGKQPLLRDRRRRSRR